MGSNQSEDEIGGWVVGEQNRVSPLEPRFAGNMTIEHWRDELNGLERVLSAQHPDEDPGEAAEDVPTSQGDDEFAWYEVRTTSEKAQSELVAMGAISIGRGTWRVGVGERASLARAAARSSLDAGSAAARSMVLIVIGAWTAAALILAKFLPSGLPVLGLMLVGAIAVFVGLRLNDERWLIADWYGWLDPLLDKEASIPKRVLRTWRYARPGAALP